jgi:anti-sigma factor RsiW
MMRHLNCMRVNGLLSAYIDEELTAAQKLLVERHLVRCGACREELESLQQTKQLLAGLHGRVSHAARTGAAPAPAGHHPGRNARTPILQRHVPAPLAIAAAAGVIGIAVFVRTSTSHRGIVFEKTMPVAHSHPSVPVNDVMFLHDAWDPSAQVRTPSIVPVGLAAGGAAFR